MAPPPKLIWLHLPSLTTNAMAQPAWTALSPTHHARLVAGFPWWPWTVHVSMCTGLRPADHGCLRRATPTKSGVLRELATRARHVALEGPASMVQELSEHSDVDLLHLSAPALTPDSQAAWAEALGALVAETAGGGTRVLVTGDRPVALAPRRVDRAVIGENPGLEVVELHERVALLRGNPNAAWRDDVLSVTGVDRILEGRGLELFGANADHLVAIVLSPSTHFDHGESGPPSWQARESAPVILGWGSERIPPWTDAVHDYRVAATLLAIVAESDPRASAGGAAAALRF